MLFHTAFQILIAVVLLIASGLKASANVEDVGGPGTANWTDMGGGGVNSFDAVFEGVRFAPWASIGGSTGPRVGNLGNSQEDSRNTPTIGSTPEYDSNGDYSSSIVGGVQFPSWVRESGVVSDTINNLIGDGFSDDGISDDGIFTGAPGYGLGLVLSSPLTLSSGTRTGKKRWATCTEEDSTGRVIRCETWSADSGATANRAYDQQSFNPEIGAGSIVPWGGDAAYWSWLRYTMVPSPLYFSDVAGGTVYSVDGQPAAVFGLEALNASPYADISPLNVVLLEDSVDLGGGSIPEPPIPIMLLIGFVGIALIYRRTLRPNQCSGMR